MIVYDDPVFLTCRQCIGHKIAGVMNESRKAEQLDRWLTRYGMPDALARWRGADAAKAPSLAFMAVAGDPRLLMRLNRDVAEKLARQAEQIAHDFDSTPETVEATRIAAEVVAGRINAWKEHISSISRPRPRKLPDMDAEIQRRSEERVWTNDEILAMARRSHPYYRDLIGQRLAQLILQLGVDGLVRLGSPMDAVIALAAARCAAKSITRDSSGAPVASPRCVEIITTVQAWSERSGINPFIFDLDGSTASLAKEEAALLRETNTCATVAALSGAGANAPGFDMWETAEEFHAYAAMSVRSRVFDTMDYDQGQFLASAGARLAEAAVADPSLRIPVFPAEAEAMEPRLVRAAAGALLRRGLAPRRSAAITRG